MIGGFLLAAPNWGFACSGSARAVVSISQPSSSNNEWIRTARILVAEAYNPPFYPELDYDPEKAVRLAKALHADSFRFPALSYYAYYPTRTNFPIHPALTGDPMRETLRLCRMENIRTIAYLPVNHPFMDIHDQNPHYPAWQKRDSSGKPFITSHMGFSRYYEGCLNSSLRREIFAYLHEVLEYDFDLIYFDGPYQGMDHRMEFCHCESCRASYLKAKGRDIPAPGAPADAVISCTNWINGVAKDMLEELATTVRSLRGLPVLYNNTSILNRGWCRSHAFSAADGFMFEGAVTPEDKLFTLQLGKSTNKVVWSYVGYHSQYNREHLRDKSIRGWFSYPVDGDDLLMDGFVAIASSVGLVFWSLSRLYAMPQPPGTYAEGKHVREIFNLMQNHGSLLGLAHISPQAGVLVSSQTIEWCNADSYIPAAYQNGFHGIWRVMQEGSFTCEPFLDFGLERTLLQRYTLIFVSNAACLSSSQCAMLADFVQPGGTLIATHLSGLYDEFGRAQIERPLHKLLGIQFASDEPIERSELYLRFPDNPPLIPQDPQIVRFDTVGETRVLANTYDLAYNTMIGPAITQRTYGKGQAIYIGSSLESII